MFGFERRLGFGSAASAEAYGPMGCLNVGHVPRTVARHRRKLALYRGFEYRVGSRTKPARHSFEAEKFVATIVAQFVARGWKSRIRPVENQPLVGWVRIPPAPPTDCFPTSV